MTVAVVAPVYNEAQFLPYSIMAAHPYVSEFIYAVSPKSNDGTIEILQHIADKYGKVKMLLEDKYDFNPMDLKAYNASFNDCIEKTKCSAVWFLHPDMIVTKWVEPKSGPLAWTVNVTSYAGDLNTQITKGRATKWKNIHARKFGLLYYGGYGSQNEDFYHSEITGNAYKHFGTEFSKYPFEVSESGIELNHYCEVKGYRRRLEKMKLCLKTQNPTFADALISDMAIHHPRVTLDASNGRFGTFNFQKVTTPIPDVFTTYKAEFEPFMKAKGLVNV